MFSKEDVRNWMIKHKVYDGSIRDIDKRLFDKCDCRVCYLSSNFDKDLEEEFDKYFASVCNVLYSDLPDKSINYNDILNKL